MDSERSSASTRSHSTGDIPAFIVRGLRFAVVLLVVYAATIVVTSRVTAYPQYLARLTNLQPVTAPGQAFLAFQEVMNHEKVDIVFIGSSHAYRSFDPRVFAREGLSTFNLGTRAQTPLNSYFLLKEYIGTLRPKLVIFETYPIILGNDGRESSLDLVNDLPLSWSLARMAAASWDVSVWNKLFLRWIGPDLPAVSDRAEILPTTDTYVGRGYVEKDPRFVDSRPFQPESVTVSNDQVKYLERSIDMLRDQGIQVVLVVTPLPRQTVAGILNYDDVSREQADLAARAGVLYLDFNLGGQLDLDRAYFYDSHHLHQSGVELFLDKLILDLRARGLVPQVS
jgi:hypothetical protein